MPLTAFERTQPVPTREHRAIWMSPMLNYTWPYGSINKANAEARKRNLRSDFARLKSQGINTVYYHVRANCDATYASSYEPYSAAVADGRGGTPFFDPFAFVIEAGHDAGIEVYAWVNPYRYSPGKEYGAGERNYENSHPDWLIRRPTQYILNPGIPEVQDRIEAIITEIAENYDIDGMIFDDYFYTASTPASADAETFAAYRAAGGTIEDQMAWRRENVNETVRRAREAVKKARPYAVFCMGPAGRISPPNVADYGLEPGPHGDMNYTSLHADPLHWLDEGWLDFLSPQVYWPDMFDALTDWYSIALPSFGRHLYTSVDCSRLSKHKAEEYLREIDYMRARLRPNENGVVFFDYGAYVNFSQTFEDEFTPWGEILANNMFYHTTLQPLHYWRGKYSHVTVKNVRRQGNTVEWDAPEGVENHRYAVYAVPAEQKDRFAGDRSCLVSVRYTESCEIPEEFADRVIAVSVYDRYGYEYSPLFEGQTPGTVDAPVVSSPANGSAPDDLFDFEWTAAPGRYIVEVSETADFATLVGMAETDGTKITSTDVASLKDGVQYFWRVRVLSPKGAEAVSAPSSFTSSRVTVTSPYEAEAGVSATPVFKWSAAGEGSEYKLEISVTRNFATIAHSAVVNQTSYAVPAKTLQTGMTYYARVTATRGSASSQSAIRAFSTVDVDNYAAPVFVNPSADGVTLCSDQSVEVEPWDGFGSITVQISKSSSFPVRSGTLTLSLSNFECSTSALGSLKLSGKTLENGTTYYVRACGNYRLTTSSAVKTTEYTPVRTFVYNSEAGVENVTADNAKPYVDGDILYIEGGYAFEICDIAGRMVMTGSNSEQTRLDSLVPGAYIIRVYTPNICTLKMVKQ